MIRLINSSVKDESINVKQNFTQYLFFENYTQKVNKIIIQNLKQEIEKKDEIIMHSRWRKDNGYVVKDIQPRTIITIYGAVTFFRRRYTYFDKIKNKKCYVFLVDQEFQIETRQRISLHLKLKILEEISNGSRQIDIFRLYKFSGITQMAISNIIKEANLDKLLNNNSQEIKKLPVKDYLHIWIDETFLKLRNKKGRAIKYRFRLVIFHTGKKLVKFNLKRYRLINKRAFCFVAPEKELINTKKFARKIYDLAHKFYELKEAKIIIGGDGAQWISEISHYIHNSSFVLDLFHSTRQLYWHLKKKKNYFYNGVYSNAVALLKTGNYNELLVFLRRCLIFMNTEEQKEKLKNLVKYFRLRKQGVINQGAKWNIGVNAEGQVSHIIKRLLNYGAKTFNVKTFSNMLNSHISKINNINLILKFRNQKENELIANYQKLKINNWLL